MRSLFGRYPWHIVHITPEPHEKVNKGSRSKEPRFFGSHSQLSLNVQFVNLSGQSLGSLASLDIRNLELAQDKEQVLRGCYFVLLCQCIYDKVFFLDLCLEAQLKQSYVDPGGFCLTLESLQNSHNAHFHTLSEIGIFWQGVTERQKCPK